MKNYLLILLSVMGIGLLIDNINSTTPVSGVATSAEIAQVEEIPTLSKIEEVKTESIQEINATAKITPVSTTKSPSYRHTAAGGPNYRITAHPSTVQSKNLTGTDIYKTRKLVYGHNSDNLLGSIKNLGIGSTFTITENGVTTTYRVADSRIFQKTGDYTLGLCASGYENCSGTYYISSLQNATFMGKSYDVALFTCDGTNLGGGDATHRRIVFAYKI